MVEYDSIIPPGRVGEITQAVRIKGLHGGSFRKGMRVILNDSANTTLRLSLSGKILPILGVSPRYLRLKSSENAENASEVVLTTEQKNLKVKDIVFKERGGAKDGPAWQSSLPYFIEHETTRSDTADKDGYYTYTVKIALKTVPKQNRPGEFIFKTNNRKMSEITVRGMIEPGD
ncbi:MAG: hypothetical protein GF344_06910 [Chitinivibrionales bacterium]|nr:hypothetical protein [Chitinivibrionales bacterium]MBD3356650.1 hypothetical protein [Chitinivibrionales bacterium]